MPLIIEGPVPPRWESRGQLWEGMKSHLGREGSATVALINNMPDAALEDTELQFFELLDIASGDTPVFLKLYSTAGIPRAELGQRRLDSFYFHFADLWNSHFDGVIITGTEPLHPDLRNEPYWHNFAGILDWAAENTTSTVLSCLAAHASVFHFDSISRHRLPDKQFGVFESRKKTQHAIVEKTPEVVRFPHSRWNEVRGSELKSAGYDVLTESAEAGVDLFVKQKKKSLFVHFQGHPEYGALTLMKEYRRDIRRFLRGERDTYPNLPKGYFEPATAQLLEEFRQAASRDKREEGLQAFPAVPALQNTWHSSAVCIYRNWLRHIESKKAADRVSSTIVPEPKVALRKKSVAR